MRLGLRNLLPGVGFCTKCRKFSMSEDQKTKDLKSTETPEARTARVLNLLMNSLEPDLKFTTETVGDFKARALPTLDYQLWVDWDWV